jgi:CubicO group peptidase (beta-lactamase class C family)
MTRSRVPFRALTVAAAAVLFGAIIVVAVRRSAAPPHVYRYAAPLTLDDGWATGTLEQAGIDRRRIEAMTDFVLARPDLNVHVVLIERGGRLVYEEYFSGSDESWGRPLGVVRFSRDRFHDLRSITKSVVSALVGIATDAHAIRSIDAPLLDYFPEYEDLRVPERQQITVRHALMMSAGFDWNEDVPYNDPRNDEMVMTRSAEPMRYVLARPIVAPPGTTFRYNGGTTQALGTIVQRATGRPLADYARDMLWTPLGIDDVEWKGRIGGVPSAASGLRLKPRDLAKFGSLYLHDGLWAGRQIVPSAWVRESTRQLMTFPNQRDRGYGYQWWHACYHTWSGAIDVPTAVGNGAQRIFLLPAQQTVVTVLSGRYNDFSANPPERLLLDYVVPALPRASTSGC